MDAYDFFSVSLNVTRLTVAFGRSSSDITTSITLTLLFRSLGAVTFGLLSDRYGRKWPLVGNLFLIAVFSLATGFCRSFGAFLAVRCLFGIAMGGIWGMSAATALENAPAQARGLLSGILQQGYAFGYLIAASVNLSSFMEGSTDRWPRLFYLGAGLSLFAAIFRACLPESELFLRGKAERAAVAEQGVSKDRAFGRALLDMLKTHWKVSIYGILFMTGFNFLSHSSQDLYPTMIQKVSLARLPTPEAAHLSSMATIIGNCGAIAGGLLAGYTSQYLGRRLTMCLFIVLVGVLIPAWILPTSFSGLAAGAFFIQFGVQGAWGVVPIYLNEIAPPAFRAVWAGLSYQLGNMVSSASAQIEARGGESLQIHNPKCPYNAAGVAVCPSGQEPTIADYAKVSAILLGVVCGYLLLVIIFLGTEARGAHFETAPPAVEAGAGKVTASDLREDAGHHGHIGQEKDIEHVGDRDTRSQTSSSKEKI